MTDHDPHLAPSPIASDRDGAEILRTIASFLTLSDATSMVSIALPSSVDHDYSTVAAAANGSAAVNTTPFSADSDSWAVGEDMEQLNTPATPAMMAISPGGTPRYVDIDLSQSKYNPQKQQEHPHSSSTRMMLCSRADDYCEDDFEFEELLQERKRRWAQERLAAAVFAHPRSVRSYCVEAYAAASEIRQLKDTAAARPSIIRDEENTNPETHREPPTNSKSNNNTNTNTSGYQLQQQHQKYRYRQQQQQQQQQQMRRYRPRFHHRRRRKDFAFVHDLVDSVLHNVPLSVLFDLVACSTDVYCESVSCTFRISAHSMKAVVSALSHAILVVWDGITNFNPFAVLDAIISLQVNAMGKTSEVLASGIQSVATGVESASSLALHRLSRSGVGSLSAAHRTGSSSGSMGGTFSQQRRSSSSNRLQKELLRKVSTINSAAEVISYRELKDDTGGLSRHAKSRVQRMMHYDVSLRPFVATVAMPPTKADRIINNEKNNNGMNSNHSFGNVEFAGLEDKTQSRSGTTERRDSSSSTDSSPMGSPFMCTPQSFPPTPASRNTVLARSTRFADDVVFLARDKIRVHEAKLSENERTREMARALSEGKRLAVFDAKDAGNGIELTCGQHLATKVGNMLYCSARSMVPILRNCYVYFEMTVMPSAVGNNAFQASMVTLSIGLSTVEMPSNTLVGAWSGSVGLCTTGQILTAGQWCSPGEPYSWPAGATVGVLVNLDDSSALEHWDGVMITAQVTYNGTRLLASRSVRNEFSLELYRLILFMLLLVHIVNGRIVTPPVSTLPTTGGASGMHPGAQMQMGLLNGSLGYGPQNPLAPNSTLPLLVPAAEELYPTVTLHSPASAIMCRFSAEDIVANSRESIGAPESRTIYAVDGSVISFAEES